MADSDQIKFASTHEWVSWQQSNGMITVGISEYAQDSLGDIVYVELPKIDSALTAGEEAGTIESVKTAAEFYAPVSGIVAMVNEKLAEMPEVVNSDCYGDGWLIRMYPDDVSEMDSLMSMQAYEESCSNNES